MASGSPRYGPACTFVEISGFIDPQWLVEFEVDAVVDTGDRSV